MSTPAISSGTAHKLPDDFRKALLSSAKARTTWEDISALARNEWICWVITVKKQETRTQHMKRAIEDLAAGERRPCCWMGCVHRTDKPMNRSQKWILARKSKRT